jgi:prolyl-tRNA synthetase
MRWSKYLLTTLKETPTEAEVISHVLMLRGGMIRKVAAGIYNFLPFCWRAIRKFEQIVREEMDKSAQEILMPILTPAELWMESGRWDVYGKELMRLQDRKDAGFALGPTHEEVVTELVRREVRSYRQLPLCLYQIQDKFRDEVRPRFGVMRGREFIMKDGYSFHRDRADLDAYYQVMYATYTCIFKRCGLDFRPVLADPGAIGGNETHEFMVLAENGESGILWCPDAACGYAATDEVAASVIPVVEPQAQRPPMDLVETPGCASIEDVARFLGAPTCQCAKAMIYRGRDGLVLAFVRGDRQLNEAKLRAAAGGGEIALATDEAEVRQAGLSPGYTGPVGLRPGLRVFADSALRDMANLVVGGNRDGFHYRNANWDRDMARPAFLDLTLAVSGDGCPRCGRPLSLSRGIEVGQVFKLGTKYSDALKATFLDEDGKEKPFVMGCYGIGITRTIGAAIEQNNDRDGIVWPISLAPFEVLVTSLGAAKEEVRRAADSIYQDLVAADVEVLYDDRELSPGVKLKDADLIGLPVRVVVGDRGLKEGVVEVRLRKTGHTVKALPAEAVPVVRRNLAHLWQELNARL